MFNNVPNHSSKFRNCVEKNDDLRGTYNTNSQINFKTKVLRSSLRDYSYAYVLVKGTIAIAGAERAETTVER